MSLDIRYLMKDDGSKKCYTVRDSLHETFNIYEKLEDVPVNVRHYAETTKLQKAGPDLARVLGVKDYLYPNFPNCGHPEYAGKVCIAEMCRYGEETDEFGIMDYRKCPYFDKEYIK